MPRGLSLPHPCTVLHRTADLEVMIYGSIVSESVRSHMRSCREVYFAFS